MGAQYSFLVDDDANQGNSYSGSFNSYGSGADDDAPVYNDFGVDLPGRFVPDEQFVEVEAPGCDDDEGCNAIPTLNIGPATTFSKAKSESASSVVASASW